MITRINKKEELVKLIASSLQWMTEEKKVSTVWNGADFCREQKARTFVTLVNEGNFKKASTKFTQQELEDIVYFAD